MDSKEDKVETIELPETNPPLVPSGSKKKKDKKDKKEKKDYVFSTDGNSTIEPSKSILVKEEKPRKDKKQIQFSAKASEMDKTGHITAVDSSFYEQEPNGPQEPLPNVPKSANTQGRIGKAPQQSGPLGQHKTSDNGDPSQTEPKNNILMSDSEDNSDSDDVNPTVPFRETEPPLVSKSPKPTPKGKRGVKPPHQRRIEPITDEGEKKRFEELRAAVLSVSTYAGHVCENIDKFFKYNKNNIVRSALRVEEMEQKKARTWVFFLLMLQFLINAGFLAAIVYCGRSGKPYAAYFFAGTLGFYFIIRIISVSIFLLRRGAKNFGRCCEPGYDANNEKYEEVFICIPAYNEGKEAFMNTIGSIAETNYPKHKMYMFFIVDGNKACSFENLMECLLKKPYLDPVPAKHRILLHGVYEGIPYSVFLKEENRGKRDSQWLFVELLRNMIPEFAPTYVFFVDSDTAFHPDSLRHMVENFGDDQKIAGVCGKLTLSNFKFFDKDCSNTFYFLSTMFVVGYQFYEYHYNQIIGKQSEAAFSAVSCLPGAFSVFRANALTNVETRIGERIDEELSSQVINKMGPFSYYYYRVKQTLPLVLDDFFSKPTHGIANRNLYELGEDRTLTIRFLEKGLKCLYEPRAVAYTECPDSIVKYFQQRRRWNNSTFVNLAYMMPKGTLWCQLRSLPIQVFAFFDLFGAYILPANALLLMYVIWDPLFKYIRDHTNGKVDINVVYIILILLVLQALVITTTNLVTADMFYVFLTFLMGLMMLVAFPFFVIFCKSLVNNFIDDPSQNWAPFVILALFPLMHTIMSVTKPPAFFTVVFYWAMIPMSALTLPFYSFVHLDDFSWGNR